MQTHRSDGLQGGGRTPLPSPPKGAQSTAISPCLLPTADLQAANSTLRQPQDSASLAWALPFIKDSWNVPFVEGQGAISHPTAWPWPGSKEPETQRQSSLASQMMKQKPQG